LKTLHTYLSRQILASLMMTVAVFTFVLLLGNVLKEILNLLINRQASFGLVLEAVGLLVPFVWVFALPMGILTATLLIFGRFSADQELTAVRASGISLLTLVTPVLLLSLLLCGVSAAVNMEIGPRCRMAYTRMLSGLKIDLTAAQLPEGRPIKDFKGFIFYVEKNRRGVLQDVMVFVLQNETNVVTTVRAPRGSVEIDNVTRKVRLQLFDARLVAVNEGRAAPGILEEWSLELDLNPEKKRSLKPKISDMSFTQLREEMLDLEQTMALPAALRNVPRSQLSPEAQEFVRRREELLSTMRFHMHRQVAFSFACFGFALVGIPLGIRVHRRETNIGIFIALILAVIYFGFVLLAQSLDKRPDLMPHLIIWLPNFLFQGAGAWMLWRANRG